MYKQWIIIVRYTDSADKSSVTEKRNMDATGGARISPNVTRLRRHNRRVRPREPIVPRPQEHRRKSERPFCAVNRLRKIVYSWGRAIWRRDNFRIDADNRIHVGQSSASSFRSVSNNRVVSRRLLSRVSQLFARTAAFLRPRDGIFGGTAGNCSLTNDAGVRSTHPTPIFPRAVAIAARESFIEAPSNYLDMFVFEYVRPKRGTYRFRVTYGRVARWTAFILAPIKIIRTKRLVA